MIPDPDYVPSEKEEYMNARQLAYFKRILLEKQAELVKHISSPISTVAAYEADMSDNASIESESYTERQTRSVKSRNLLAIDRALKRIANGEYGYCIESGKKIGLRRLLVNPSAALCIEEQEKFERSGRDEEDLL